MKKLFIIVGLAAFFTAISCSQNSEKFTAKNSGAAIKFETSGHDFGTIPFKGDGTYEFVFKNTGKEPLLLTNVRSSCGCTIPEWPKDPINKGEKGKIKVRYDTRVTGTFSKSISVFSNATAKPIILTIKGKVEESPDDLTAAPAKN
jgi:hypothetical protein